MTEHRLMPDPWFRGEARAQPIQMMLSSQYVLREANPALGERQLGPFVLPPFQRPPVWTEAQQIKLIESIWSGLPVGAYVYNQAPFNHPCDGWLLDGQQRVTAILAYVDGVFEVFGYRFTDLSRPEQRGFLMRPIAALLTSITSAKQCEDVYNRLAYGGTPHTPM